METRTEPAATLITSSTRTHPLLLTAAAAVTLVSATGIAAMAGWLPTSRVAPEIAPQAIVAPAIVAPAAVAVAPAPAPAVARPAPVRTPNYTAQREAQLESQRVAQLEVKRVEQREARREARQERRRDESRYENPRYESQRDDRNNGGGYQNSRYDPAPDYRPAVLSQNQSMEKSYPVQTAQPARAICNDCGTIESVQQVERPGEGSGVGVGVGAVAGGLLGRQMGGGRGRDVMTVLGAVGGAVAGNHVEKNVRKVTDYKVTVRFEDGSTQTLTQTTAPGWRPGDRVRMVNGSLQANG